MQHLLNDFSINAAFFFSLLLNIIFYIYIYIYTLIWYMSMKDGVINTKANFFLLHSSVGIQCNNNLRKLYEHQCSTRTRIKKPGYSRYNVRYCQI